jgi:hypothetical protein
MVSNRSFRPLDFNYDTVCVWGEGFVVSGSTEPVESLWVERLGEVSAEREG